MNKKEFVAHYLKYMDSVDEIIIRIWNGFDLNNEPSSWLDVYFNDMESTQIYETDYHKDTEEDKKELIKCQKKWHKKISNWISPTWDLKIVVDEVNI